MGDTRWTKGEWRQAKRGPNNCPIVSCGGVLLAMVSTGIDFQEQADANADLMCAAPELYRALEDLADLMDDVHEGLFQPDSSTTQLARAALINARNGKATK